MIDPTTNINQLLCQAPECGEFLYPFLEKIQHETTLGSLAQQFDVSVETLKYGLMRTTKRAVQYPCDYEKMRNRLIKPGHVNVAGFVNFIWQEQFVTEMKKKAKELNLALNLNIFPKHSKKEFQNYLAVCNSPDDLPDIIIGKGFSSLMTQRFVSKFIKPGHFSQPAVSNLMGEVFAKAGLRDAGENYHPFGVEEMVMVHDKTIPFNEKIPTKWISLLKPCYANSIMQMGKSQRDHFGFNIMLYLYSIAGEKGIQQYASNVKNKQHFSYIIKNIAQNNNDSAPISIVQQYTTKFIRSDAKPKTDIIQTEDGNPCVCVFFLIKNNIDRKALELAKHFYSPEIKKIMEKCGTTHITSKLPLSGNNKVQWIGWDRVKELPLPFLKEELSEIAFQKYLA